MEIGTIISGPVHQCPSCSGPNCIPNYKVEIILNLTVRRIWSLVESYPSVDQGDVVLISLPERQFVKQVHVNISIRDLLLEGFADFLFTIELIIYFVELFCELFDVETARLGRMD